MSEKILESTDVVTCDQARESIGVFLEKCSPDDKKAIVDMLGGIVFAANDIRKSVIQNSSRNYMGILKWEYDNTIV